MGYIALDTIRHNGVEYKAGSIIADISEEAAKELIDLKVLQSSDGQSAPQEPAQQMTNDAKVNPDELTPEQQAELDIAQNQKDQEALKSQPAQPVTIGAALADQVAAEAAKVK